MEEISLMIVLGYPSHKITKRVQEMKREAFEHGRCIEQQTMRSRMISAANGGIS